MAFDPEILEGFKQESTEILGQLTVVVEKLEEKPSEADAAKLLAEFSQKIDRIMGTVNTLEMESPGHPGLKRIGAISLLCKNLGYRASHHPEDRHLLPFFSAFWADTLEVVQELVEKVEDDAKSQKIASSFAQVLQKRLEWLSKKVKDAPGAFGTGPKPGGSVQAEIEDLLKNLGM